MPMTRSRVLRAGAALPFFAALLFAGCAGTTTDTQSIMALSTPEVLDPEVRSAGLEDLKLSEQSPANVKVFEQRPEFAYFVVDSFRTTFHYETDSMNSKNLEKTKHVKKLRALAGKRGANGLIVAGSKLAPKAFYTGGIWTSKGSEPMPTTHNKTRIYVTSYAIYYRWQE
jgi:hypothetical protein